jgi:hypothetical protein
MGLKILWSLSKSVKVSEFGLHMGSILKTKSKNLQVEKEASDLESEECE